MPQEKRKKGGGGGPKQVTQSTYRLCLNQKAYSQKSVSRERFSTKFRCLVKKSTLSKSKVACKKKIQSPVDLLNVHFLPRHLNLI